MDKHHDEPILRQCSRADFNGMWRVRYAVNENRLSSGVLNDEMMRLETEVAGRDWVIEAGGEILAFAIGNAETGNIWALFVDPAAEGRGYARRLLTVMVEWLWAQGLQRLKLSTDAGTRAENFYRRAGWKSTGLDQRGEMHFELFRDDSPSADPTR